jgi:hypothetical protein
MKPADLNAESLSRRRAFRCCSSGPSRGTTPSASLHGRIDGVSARAGTGRFVAANRYNSSALTTPRISPTLENLAKKQSFANDPAQPPRGPLHLCHFRSKLLFLLVLKRAGEGAAGSAGRSISSAWASRSCRARVATLPARRCISPQRRRFSLLKQSLANTSCSSPVFPVTLRA